MRLIAITCVDDGNSFRLIYHFDDGKKVVAKQRKVPKKKPVTKTISDKYPTAEYYEREAHDLFGVEFDGNEHLHEKIFLADDCEGEPPLRRKK